MLVLRDGQQLSGFEYDKVRALLAYLVMEADRPHRREALAGLLWPEQSEKAARDSLRNALATLRRAIGDDGADPPFLFITREAVQFNLSSDHVVDTAEFIHQFDLCAHHRHRNSSNCRICAGWRRRVAELYRGPLLAQFSLPDSAEFESWLVTRREDFHRAAMASFAWLANFYLQRRDYATARFFAGRQLALEPWAENAHRQAMRSLAPMGDRNAALRQYIVCRQVLQEELGVSPEPETVLLYERIRDGNLERAPTARAVAAPNTALIGREKDLNALETLIADPDIRLVTILGPGGVGKTSLAQQAAHQFSGDFSDGSVFVSLAAASGSDDIFPAIASALDLTPEPSLPAEEQLTEYLRAAEMLLVLDNFERLVSAADRLSRLFAAAPRLVLLVTSRERLGLATEWLYDLQGLDFPTGGNDEPLASYGALQLFARRARQERGDFALFSSEATAAAEICRLVQGMPLAIELAAAATGVQSTVEIARQLHSGLDALSVEWADLPERHRSVRAAFEHSWAMLTDDDRRILRRLSVFTGGFDADGAEAITGSSLGDLRRLRDKSLVQTRGDGRFNLHPLIRAFAAERLEARGEAGEAQESHLRYFTQMAEEGEAGLKGPEQLAWIRRLEADHANILAALSHAENNGQVEAAHLAAVMWLFWFMRGHLHESRRHYEGLYPCREQWPIHVRARFLNGYTSTVMGQGDFGAIEPLAGEALACYQAVGDDEGVALSLHHLAISWRVRGEFSESATCGNDSIAAARRVAPAGSSWVLTIALNTLSSTYLDMEQPARAVSLMREAEAITSANGDQWAMAYTIVRLAECDLVSGSDEQARAKLLKALALAEAYGDKRLIAATTIRLSKLALGACDLDEAWVRAESAERHYQEVGNRLARAEALGILGDVLLRRGYPQEAALRYEEAKAVYLASGDERAAQKVDSKLSDLEVAGR